MTLIDKAEALLPCPFCGGEATFSEGKTGDGKPWHYVECSDCEAMGPGVSYADHNIAVKSALADAWNHRALPARGVGVKPDRDTFDAMCAMRDSINEHVPMPSLESDLLQGPENSVFCATVAEAVINEVTRLRSMANGARVKRLEWHNFDAWTHWAEGACGTYHVEERNGYWQVELRVGGLVHGVTETGDTTPEDLEAAKAAAQADYEARILAALTPTDAAHVNETPKSEHDAGNVLTAAAQSRAPFFFDRYINGVRMAEGVCIERETTLEGAMQAAVRIAAKGPKGEAPVLVYRAPTDAAQARPAGPSESAVYDRTGLPPVTVDAAQAREAALRSLASFVSGMDESTFFSFASDMDRAFETHRATEASGRILALIDEART